MIRTQRNSHLNWHEKRNYHYRYLSKVGLRIFEYSYLSYKKFSSLKAGTYVQAQRLVRLEHVKATTWKRKQGSVNLEVTKLKRQNGSDNLWPLSASAIRTYKRNNSSDPNTWKRQLGSDNVEATTWKRQLVTLIGFCIYCELIECSRPIRFFIVCLMHNKYQYWPSESQLILFS